MSSTKKNLTEYLEVINSNKILTFWVSVVQTFNRVTYKTKNTLCAKFDSANDLSDECVTVGDLILSVGSRCRVGTELAIRGRE